MVVAVRGSAGPSLRSAESEEDWQQKSPGPVEPSQQYVLELQAKMLAADEGMRSVAEAQVGVNLLDVWVGEGG